MNICAKQFTTKTVMNSQNRNFVDICEKLGFNGNFVLEFGLNSTEIVWIFLKFGFH